MVFGTLIALSTPRPEADAEARNSSRWKRPKP